MLILSRRIGESIIIGNGENKIVVKFLKIQGKNAKLGIEAPKSVTVHREEIYRLIQTEPETSDDARDN